MHNRHEEVLKFFKYVLCCKYLEFKTILCDEVNVPINDVGLLITIGGDGTHFNTHYIENAIPIYRINSNYAYYIEVCYSVR